MQTNLIFGKIPKQINLDSPQQKEITGKEILLIIIGVKNVVILLTEYFLTLFFLFWHIPHSDP